MTAGETFDKEEVFLEIEELCQSKADEFVLLGYDNISAKDIWECVSQAYKELPRKHQLVNDILSLKPNKYMNYLMINMYKNSGRI